MRKFPLSELLAVIKYPLLFLVICWGVFCPKPSGAFYCIARLPIDNSDKFCQWLLEEFSFDGQTVMMAPATGFYSTPGAGTNEVRLAYVLNKEDLKNAIMCLKEALKVYPGKTN